MQQLASWTVMAQPTTPATLLVQANSSRIALCLSMLGMGQSMLASPDATFANAGFGFQVSSTVPVFLTVAKYGLWVVSEWYVIGIGGGVTATALELYDTDVSFPPDGGKSGILIQPFAADPHRMVPGIDVPDEMIQLITQLKRTHMRLRG